MHDHRPTETQAEFTNASAPTTLADRLGRKFSSKWASTSCDGPINLAVTVLVCGLSAFLVDAAFLQGMGLVPAA